MVFIDPAKSSPDDKKLLTRVIRAKVVHIDILNSSLKMLPDIRSVKKQNAFAQISFFLN